MICVEKYTKATRAPIICGKCEFECCKKCFIRYILDPQHYLQCMGCHEEFNREELVNRMTKTFMKKEFKMIQSEQFFEKEKAFMGITQLKIEAKHLKAEITTMRIERDQSTDRKERRELTIKMWDNEERLDEISKLNMQQAFSIPCVNAECRGIISKSAFDDDNTLHCGLCKITVCSECQCETDDDHTCNDDILQNVKAIAKSSKPCPGCSVRISRIDGCSQMFCTQCFTLFDYGTLRIETGFRHNPHYLTWVGKNPDRKDEVNTNVQPNANDKYRLFNRYKMETAFLMAHNNLARNIIPQRLLPEFTEAHKVNAARLLAMKEWVVQWASYIRSTHTSIIYDQKANHINRTKYLTNQYTEEEFKKQIYRKCSEIEYNRELIDVFYNIYKLEPALRMIARSIDDVDNLTLVTDFIKGACNVVTLASIALKDVQHKWMKNEDCQFREDYQEAEEPKAEEATI